jgi:hypothetical protein
VFLSGLLRDPWRGDPSKTKIILLRRSAMAEILYLEGYGQNNIEQGTPNNDLRCILHYEDGLQAPSFVLHHSLFDVRCFNQDYCVIPGGAIPAKQK